VKLILVTREGGQVKADMYFNVLKLAEKHGPEAAVEFANFEAANVAAVKALVETENIDCDLRLTRTMDVYLDEEHAKSVVVNYRQLVKAGIANLEDVMFQRGERAEAVSRSLFSFVEL
jgi:hypothetical protein